ncbi:hypothetical protein G0Q06_03115 [Puniceicoccales bacterium CK1056]|uniref:NIPSNAP domain-containing protein n=1 Tax=Oceanipulchritudo coccoides TaxID=2706888 RepID=A0A6B2LYH0_9BACT|nr:hypothetical protein [Oceanipulchritudo coccoides]NDV61433.1 hypothetical protein [Oceanipulchritudo coccoides]
MRNGKWNRLGLIMAVCIGFVSQILNAEEQNLAQVYFITAKMGHEADLYEKIKEHAAWRKEAGDPWAWSVYQTVTGSELGKYVIRSGNHGWSCWDAYEEFNATASAEWNEHVAPHVGSTTSLIMEDAGIADWPTEPGSANLIDVYWYDLKPGTMEAFFESAKMYHKAIQENDRDVHYSFAKTVSGGPSNRIVLALPFANYAAMEGPDEDLREFFARVMDEEDLKTAGEKWIGSIDSTEGYIIRFHPELSVLPDHEE